MIVARPRRGIRHYIRSPGVGRFYGLCVLRIASDMDFVISKCLLERQGDGICGGGDRHDGIFGLGDLGRRAQRRE